MQTTANNHAIPSEVTILARILLNLGFTAADKSRMHDLALRNQEGILSPSEKEQLSAYGKVGTLLSILKSKARRVLRIKPLNPG
jgi:hypothetical protein